MPHLVNERYMHEAIKEAKKAKDLGDYAIGAVIVRDEEIIGRGANNIIESCDPTGHAEIVAIRDACEKEGSRHLEGAVLYSTAEPCPMCAGAAVMAKLDGIVYGSTREDMDSYGLNSNSSIRSWRINGLSCYDVAKNGRPPIFIFGTLLKEECLKLFHDD